MKIIVNNKRANFEYFLYDTFEAGIVLEGSEVKSLRNNEDHVPVVRDRKVCNYDQLNEIIPQQHQLEPLLNHEY